MFATKGIFRILELFEHFRLFQFQQFIEFNEINQKINIIPQAVTISFRLI